MLRPDNRIPMILSQTKHLVGNINILIGATEIIVNPDVLKKYHYDSRTRTFSPG
jgi:hypothetical protein